MEELLMGIDLGTQSVKAGIIDTKGNVIAQGCEGYQFDVPQCGYAQQDAEVWWEATCRAVKKAVKELAPGQAGWIKGIGISGQMHGLVCVGKDHKVLRPAILHCDQRSQAEIQEIYEILSWEFVHKTTMNRLCTGFLLPSLYWIRKHEPECFAAMDKVLLPKDYIRLRLTGEMGTEISDASATGIFDIENQDWSYEMIDRLEFPRTLFPVCKKSAEIAGTLKRDTAEELGLPEGICVVYGGGDQPLQGLGNGAIEPGMTVSNIGTSGQIFIVQDHPVYNPDMNTNMFCNVLPDSWYASGAIMSAGAALSWMMKKVVHQSDYQEIDRKIEKIEPGSEGVIFLPYLMGERTPHLDASVKAMFFGLSINHDYVHMTRAVMEGVCFALRDCLLTLKEHGSTCSRQIIASGGGARSQVWKQMQADILGKEIITAKVMEHACFGAAILAGIGCGVFADAREACAGMVSYEEAIYPKQENVSRYKEIYEIYKQLYIRNKNLL